MANKHILVTGGAGFIGANFVDYFAHKYANYTIINIDKLTYAGDLNNVKEMEKNNNYLFVQGDICDQKLVKSLFSEFDVRGVIHFAAESHVDNSIDGPYPFVRTNIEGTYSLLEVAKQHWLKAPGEYKPGYEDCRFHHISTDEVYGSLALDSDESFSELTPYDPSSPYSATKASSDFLVRAYHRTYGMDVTISNCSNNYGPKQHQEKFVPTIIRKALKLEPIPIYGDGKNVRDWLYVLDHCQAIDKIYHHAKAGETYNVGGRNERTNVEVVHAVCGVLDKLKPREDGESYVKLIEFVKDRAGHDKRYAINPTKIEKNIGWSAKENFDERIEDTVNWFLTRLK